MQSLPMSKHDNFMSITLTLSIFLIYAGFQTGQLRSHSLGNIGELHYKLARRRSAYVIVWSMHPVSMHILGVWLCWQQASPLLLHHWDRSSPWAI